MGKITALSFKSFNLYDEAKYKQSAISINNYD
jgi:hypothetical protein